MLLMASKAFILENFHLYKTERIIYKSQLNQKETKSLITQLKIKIIFKLKSLNTR